MTWLEYLEMVGSRDLNEGCCTYPPSKFWEPLPVPDLCMEKLGMEKDISNKEKENDGMKKTVVTKPTGKPAEPTFKYEDTYGIAKVEVFNDRAVKMTFDDGTYVSAVCAKNDVFNLDVGITICLAKRMMRGRHGDAKSGTKNYNNAIKLIHKMMDMQQKAKEEEAEKKKALREKRAKLLAKIEAKKRAHREELIAIQEEAYLRAMAKREQACMAKEDDLK